MKIVLTTPDAVKLKNAIIKAAAEGVLKTWDLRDIKYEDGTKDKALTHKTANNQWTDEVLVVLTAIVSNQPFGDDKLEAEMRWWKNAKNKPTTEMLAYVCGRVTEVILAHFRDYYSDFQIEK